MAEEEDLTRGMPPDFYIAQIKQKIKQHTPRFDEIDLINIGRHIEELCENYACEFFAVFSELKKIGYEGLEDIDAFKAIYLDVENLDAKNSDSLFIFSDVLTKIPLVPKKEDLQEEPTLPEGENVDPGGNMESNSSESGEAESISEIVPELKVHLTYEELCWGFVQVEIEKAQRQLKLKDVVGAFELILQAQKGIMLADQVTRPALLENELEKEREERKNKKRSLTTTRVKAESSKMDKIKCFELYDAENLKNPHLSLSKKIDNIHSAYVDSLGTRANPDSDFSETMKKRIGKREKEQEVKAQRQARLEEEKDQDEDDA